MAKCPNNSHGASILLVKFITFYWDVLLRGAVTTILSVIKYEQIYVPIFIVPLLRKVLFMVDNSTLRQLKIHY